MNAHETKFAFKLSQYNRNDGNEEIILSTCNMEFLFLLSGLHCYMECVFVFVCAYFFILLSFCVFFFLFPFRMLIRVSYDRRESEKGEEKNSNSFKKCSAQCRKMLDTRNVKRVRYFRKRRTTLGCIVILGFVGLCLLGNVYFMYEPKI